MIFDENDIILKCQKRDTRAFTYIVEEYQEYVYRLAVRILNDVSDAEDVVQEVFVKAWNNLKSYSPLKSKFSTWLYTIATRTCFDELRKRKSVVTVSDEMIFELFNNDEPDDELDEQSAIELIKHLSCSLSSIQKVVFVLRDLEGYDVSEVVGLTELTEKQIKDNLFLARKSIKEKMKKIL